MQTNTPRMNLLAAIIRQAVVDYRSDRLKKRSWHEWKDAKEFLFERRRLENFLISYELQDHINCDLLRKLIRSGDINFDEVTEGGEE